LTTLADLNDHGYDASMLNGNAGSYKAQQSLLTTAVALANKGYEASTFLNGAAGSAKAQATLISSIVDLENMGFDKNQIRNMLKYNNGSFKGQKAVLSNMSKLNSLGISKKDIATILCGKRGTSAAKLNAATSKAIKSLNR